MSELNLDRIFCVTPSCVNDCGAKMTQEERDALDAEIANGYERPLSTQYYCGDE